MQIKIGLCVPNPGWEIVLAQEGLCYEKIVQDSKFDFNKFALVIPNQFFITNKKQLIEEYLEKAGMVIIDKETSSELLDLGFHSKNISCRIPQKNSMFSDVGLVDFYTKFMIPDGKLLLSLDETFSIYEYSGNGGNVVILPFSVNELILGQNAIRKRFYADRKELPSEVVSKVSKGRIREIIFKMLQHCFLELNKPLIQKWFYPSGIDNVFIFRIDTDFCSEEDAKNLYSLCTKYEINATWFVDTIDRKMLSEVYPTFTQHEIALHCERHKVFDSYKENYNNILCAVDKMKQCGIVVSGFAAPFGEWNNNLGKALEELDFEYSSEFSFDYDDLPFYPYFSDHFSSVMQIPIHPISVGRLRRSHFTDKEMVQYYKLIIDHNLSRNLPVIFYHHPHHNKLHVLEEIFAYIRSKKFWNPTMHEFAKWWSTRSDKNYSYEFSNGKALVSVDGDEDVVFRLLDSQKGSSIIHSNESYKIDELPFSKKQSLEFDEKKSMRRYHWRDSLNNYEQRKAKKK